MSARLFYGISIVAAVAGVSGCRCDSGPPGGHQPARQTGATVAKPPEPQPAKHLAELSEVISGMVLDDAYVYLALERDDREGGSGSIVRVAKTSGEKTVLAKAEPGPQAIALGGTVSGSELVWLDMGDLFRNREGAGFVRMPKDGSGAPKRVEWKPNGRTGMCTDSEAVILCRQDLVRVERDGTTRPIASSPSGSCSVLGCDATHAYLGADGKLYRAPLKPSAPATPGKGSEARSQALELFATPTDYVHGFALAGSDVYWSDNSGVYRTPLAGGKSTRVATSTSAVALVADDTHLYIAMLDGAISRVPRSGGSAAPVASTNAHALMVLRTDKTHLYWTASDGLWSVKK